MTAELVIEHIQGAIKTIQKAMPTAKCEELKFAIEALEKQIPRKVIFVHPLQKDDNGDYMCPSCKSGTVYDAYGNKPPYCHYCGQAIKWE